MTNTFAARASSSRDVPLLVVYGEVFKLTPAQYKKFLAAVASGKDWDLSHFGKYLGTTKDVTDILKHEAQETLDSL